MAKEFESKALRAINQDIMNAREKMKGHIPVVLEKIEQMGRDLQIIEDWMVADVGFSKAQREAVRTMQDQLVIFRTWLNTVRVNRLKD